MERKLVYWFREGSEGNRSLLGGKGAGLGEMTRIGLPVPPGFTITTDACKEYYTRPEQLMKYLDGVLDRYIGVLEQETGKVLGGRTNPLLVSVRSGAPISMPGMMDTVLNLGLNHESVQGLIDATSDERFALDCYRRFIQMFGNVVMGMPHESFESILAGVKDEKKVSYDYELNVEALKTVIDLYQDHIYSITGKRFPTDPKQQLIMAIRAVFSSWNNHRAIIYRKVNKISDDLGTAVNIQCMVFGNMGFDSGTGVMFTRNPSTGEKRLFGEYLMNAQGEDVVAGIRTPKPIEEMKTEFPNTYEELFRIANILERHYRDMQDIEFTIEHSKVYVLQTRTGKRTALASMEIASQFVREGTITREQALNRVRPEEVERLMHKTIDPNVANHILAQGLAASPGAASGIMVFHSETAEEWGEQGRNIILVRPETTPEDMPGIVTSQGILTARGGMTCHAAIVARGMGKPAVVGCEKLRINLEQKTLTIDGKVFKEGEIISIDGATGKVYLGEVKLVQPSMGTAFKEILGWADGIRKLGVKANADTPEDARKARELGAEGIGLCRTEHMFMQADRLPIVREMILSDQEEIRRKALERLLPIQEEDFYGILKEMSGYPVTIRLLDPPLHEFLPNIEELVVDITEKKNRGYSVSEIEPLEDLLRKARNLQEINPMLGMRGCRLGIVYPEIYEMQARAIFRATARLVDEGCDAQPEVMIPLVSEVKELQIIREMVEKVSQDVKKEWNVDFPVIIGTMIEIPRAALTADEIAVSAQFFSFGTNDLTQTTFGFSRDDAEAKFLFTYVSDKILKDNPFAVLDERGVGKLIEIAVKLGRATRPELVIGICGEHGGEPQSIAFCHRVGLDYVSCSPFRVPVARLAAAHATLKAK